MQRRDQAFYEAKIILAKKSALAQGTARPEERGVLVRTPSDEGRSVTQRSGIFLCQNSYDAGRGGRRVDYLKWKNPNLKPFIRQSA